MKRRQFLQLASVASAAQNSSKSIVSIAYNILGGIGYPKPPDSDLPKAARIELESKLVSELQRYRPDLITFCESLPRDAAARVAKAFGMRYFWFPSGILTFPGFPYGVPGTILVKGKIFRTAKAPLGGHPADATLFTRHWASAHIEVKGERLTILSAHLHPKDSAIRMREQRIILDIVRSEVTKGASVLLQGDLNHDPKGPEYEVWRAAGLTDCFAAKGQGEANTYSSFQPSLRIDYIWAAGPIAGRLDEARVLTQPPFLAVPKAASPSALSDHLPVVARFSL